MIDRWEWFAASHCLRLRKQGMKARLWTGTLDKRIVITCSKTFTSAHKMYSHGLSPLHLPKSLLKRQVLLCAARKGQRWDDSTVPQYLSNKAAACGSVCQMDSISLAVVIVVSNKPVQRLEWHQLRAGIINVTSSLYVHVDRVAGTGRDQSF